MTADDYWVEMKNGYRWCVCHVSDDRKPIAWFYKKRQAVRCMNSELERHGIEPKDRHGHSNS